MSDEQQIARDMVGRWSDGGADEIGDIAHAIARARAEGYEAAREQAARCCDIGFLIDGSKYTSGRLEAANQIKDAIEAMRPDRKA